jgi:hypothetical protein
LQTVDVHTPLPGVGFGDDFGPQRVQPLVARILLMGTAYQIQQMAAALRPCGQGKYLLRLRSLRRQRLKVLIQTEADERAQFVAAERGETDGADRGYSGPGRTNSAIPAPQRHSVCALAMRTSLCYCVGSAAPQGHDVRTSAPGMMRNSGCPAKMSPSERTILPLTQSSTLHG